MIRHTKVSIIAFLFFFSSFSFAQESGLEIKVTESNQPYIAHTLAEGQTLYGISKTYQVEINDLMRQNGQLEPQNLKIGQDILVPISKQHICYNYHTCPQDNMVAIYYRIKAQDNLFRIARVYFNSDINQLKIINKMDRNHLAPGSTIVIGWIPYSDYLNSYLHPEYIPVVNKVTPSESTIAEQDGDVLHHSPTRDLSVPLLDSSHLNTREEEILASKDSSAFIGSSEYFKSTGADMVTIGATAYWNKNKSSKKGKFILHKSLPLDSMIEIYNPVTHASVTAKVVGNIPDNIYAPEIELVVTSEIANALGALDKKFYTKIRYRKY